MRYSLILALAAASSVDGFLPPLSVRSFAGTPVSNVALLSKRNGLHTSPVRLGDAVMSVDGGKLMVTGFLNSKERTDQFVFDILQAQSKWEKIVAFSDSTSFAKKRLISRKSRYSGLLDVLEFEEGDKYDAAVMEEKLQGCSAWLCFDCAGDKVKDSVEFAKKAGIKSMVISSTVSASDVATAGIEDALKASGLEYTFIRVGEVVEGKEGGAATASNVTDELPIEQVVRDDIVRLSAESFMMENATNKAVAFGKGDEIALEYLKELRQNGTDRRTEMSNVISFNFVEWRAIKEAEEAERNKPPPTEEEIEEQNKKLREEREEEYAEIRKEMARRREADEEKKAEKEARQLLESEWSASYWSRGTSETLEEYIEDPENWKRALEYGWAVVNGNDRPSIRGNAAAQEEDDDEDDDDDEDEEDDDDDGATEEGEQVEGVAEGEDEDAEQEGGSEVVASKEVPSSGKSKKKTKTEADVSQEIVAENKDEPGSDGTDPPQAKLDDKTE